MTFKEGQFPRTVRWPQGNAEVTYDLDTRQYSYSQRKGDPTVTPVKGFKVLTVDDSEPEPHQFKMGAFIATVTGKSITFKRAPKTPQLRNNIFKGRRKF